MTIEVELFARLRELAGRSRLSLSVNGDTLEHLRSAFNERVPAAAALASKSAIAVNECYAAADVQLKPGDRVAILPPVSGG